MEIDDFATYVSIGVGCIAIATASWKLMKMLFRYFSRNPPHLQGELEGSVNFNGKKLYQVVLTFEPGDDPVIFRRIQCSGKMWLPDRPYVSYVPPLIWGQPYEKPSYNPAKEIGHQVVDTIPVIPKKEPQYRLLFVDPGNSHAIKITVKQGFNPFSKKVFWEGAI